MWFAVSVTAKETINAYNSLEQLLQQNSRWLTRRIAPQKKLRECGQHKTRVEKVPSKATDVNFGFLLRTLLVRGTSQNLQISLLKGGPPKKSMILQIHPRLKLKPAAPFAASTPGINDKSVVGRCFCASLNGSEGMLLEYPVETKVCPCNNSPAIES